MRIFQRSVVAASLALAPLATAAQNATDASAIEIAAVEGLVSKYKPGTVNLDATIFDRIGDDLIASNRNRPVGRQAALAAALNAETYHSDSLPVTVRATEPVITGNEARIVVRVSKVIPPRPKEEWETVAVGRLEVVELVECVLERRGEDWVVRQRLHPRRAR